MGLALYCTSLLASRANGLLGCDLLSFLRHLVLELDFTSLYESVLPDIEFHPDFIESFVDFKVPIISPMATESWCSKVDDLKKALLIEKIVYKYTLNEILICGECKLFKDVYISKFKKYPSCNLFRVVAPFMADFKDFYDSECWVWYLIGAMGKLVQYPIKAKELQPTNAKKHVVLLKLDILFTSTL